MGGRKMNQDVVKGNLDLSGIATASGGAYQDVKVQGIGKIHGDVECVLCDIEGVSEVIGSIKAERATIRGKAKVRGSVSADYIAVEGSSTVEGDCRGHDIQVRGKTRVTGGIFAEKILVEGMMQVGGSCEAESFRSDGMFTIEELLTADKVFIRLEHHSRVKEIGGEEIRVERGNRRGMIRRTPCLTVESIEGDEIYLEHTKAKTVRGNNVTLGPSTQVDIVEYHTELKTIGNAKVGASRQL